jgi:hypothetical protein
MMNSNFMKIILFVFKSYIFQRANSEIIFWKYVLLLVGRVKYDFCFLFFKIQEMNFRPFFRQAEFRYKLCWSQNGVTPFEAQPQTIVEWGQRTLEELNTEKHTGFLAQHWWLEKREKAQILTLKNFK